MPAQTPNRTIVELKFNDVKQIIMPYTTPNRTIVELKCL